MRVLVIEDEAPLRAQLVERLRATGYAVDEAATGRNGQFLGEEYPIDLAVVDLGLPDRDGSHASPLAISAASRASAARRAMTKPKPGTP